ncbi:MAG: RES family NAD+ phosphorylase [Rubrobacteraceae bacterium]|nr:RES family NAD+ phosphorylase [Rubrobacteraceae bacterium]
MTERLGPPPRDLHERELPIVRLEGPWLRLHAAGRDPVFFGRTGLNRFDDPEREFGVLYAAEDAFGAFIEVYGRDPGLNLVAETDLRRRVISELAVEGGLRLVDLTGPGAARIGATGAISTDPHGLVRPWSRAIHEHPSSPDGIYYRLKHDLGRKGIAVFDREGIAGAVRSEDRGTLVDPDNAGLLGEILEEYDFGLIPS